jgi:uncharacterized Rmd1/YagE family protein
VRAHPTPACDHAEYNYSTASPPSMQNDTITISRHHCNDPAVKLAICHALAQVRACVRVCVRLCVYRGPGGGGHVKTS